MTRLLNWKALAPVRLSPSRCSASAGLVSASAPCEPGQRDPGAPRRGGSQPGDDWITHGGGWQEQRFSPLDPDQRPERRPAGPAWYADLNTYRGVEATPLEIDGVLYNISAWDVTTAYDAVTGKKLWTYDPQDRSRRSRSWLLRAGQPRASPRGTARSSSPRSTAG